MKQKTSYDAHLSIFCIEPKQYPLKFVRIPRNWGQQIRANGWVSLGRPTDRLQALINLLRLRKPLSGWGHRSGLVMKRLPSECFPWYTYRLRPYAPGNLKIEKSINDRLIVKSCITHLMIFHLKQKQLCVNNSIIRWIADTFREAKSKILSNMIKKLFVKEIRQVTDLLFNILKMKFHTKCYRES